MLRRVRSQSMTIEGRDDSELPEQCFLAVRMHGLDMSLAQEVQLP